MRARGDTSEKRVQKPGHHEKKFFMADLPGLYDA
jgi:hypothetical protein